MPLSSNDVSDELPLDSEKSHENIEIICDYCGRKVKNTVKCAKCARIFHPSCLTMAANRKTTPCFHVASKENENDEMVEEVPDHKTENTMLKMQVEYLNVLITEIRSKNSILIDNNALLMEKIQRLESNVKKNIVVSGNRNSKLLDEFRKQVHHPTKKSSDAGEYSGAISDRENSKIKNTVPWSVMTVSQQSVTNVSSVKLNEAVNLELEKKTKTNRGK